MHFKKKKQTKKTNKKQQNNKNIFQVPRKSMNNCQSF